MEELSDFIQKQEVINESLVDEIFLLSEQVAYLTQKLQGNSSEKNSVQLSQMSLLGEEIPIQEDSDLSN
ncbi:transposase [Streptococcus sp. NLN76]|uniref:transposase n=1 Tax=Streptococcus sp. NLN76 TaxID=2822800 RepID=UPI0018AA3605|nr:transposase [Streptococcus sp. NLN76]MBF8969887.1 transposase [Streptococcus sp. NLN76]